MMDIQQAKMFVRNLSSTQAAIFLSWCVSDLTGMTIADLVEFTGRERRTIYNAIYEAADHILTESKGGQTVLDNMQTLCKTCNSKKGAR